VPPSSPVRTRDTGLQRARGVRGPGAGERVLEAREELPPSSGRASSGNGALARHQRPQLRRARRRAQGRPGSPSEIELSRRVHDGSPAGATCWMGERRPRRSATVGPTRDSARLRSRAAMGALPRHPRARLAAGIGAAPGTGRPRGGGYTPPAMPRPHPETPRHGLLASDASTLPPGGLIAARPSTRRCPFPVRMIPTARRQYTLAAGLQQRACATDTCPSRRVAPATTRARAREDEQVPAGPAPPAPHTSGGPRQQRVAVRARGTFSLEAAASHTASDSAKEALMCWTMAMAPGSRPEIRRAAGWMTLRPAGWRRPISQHTPMGDAERRRPPLRDETWGGGARPLRLAARWRDHRTDESSFTSDARFHASGPESREGTLKRKRAQLQSLTRQLRSWCSGSAGEQPAGGRGLSPLMFSTAVTARPSPASTTSMVRTLGRSFMERETAFALPWAAVHTTSMSRVLRQRSQSSGGRSAES